MFWRVKLNREIAYKIDLHQKENPSTRKTEIVLPVTPTKQAGKENFIRIQERGGRKYKNCWNCKKKIKKVEDCIS